MDSKDRVILNLFYECSGTQPGQSVFVVGSIPVLGSWEINKCIEMYTDKLIYPQWTTKVLIPSGTTFEYKYLIANSHDRNIVRWEVLPYKYNRTLIATACQSIVINEMEGMFERGVEYVTPSLELGKKINKDSTKEVYQSHMTEIHTK